MYVEYINLSLFLMIYERNACSDLDITIGTVKYEFLQL